MSTRSQRVPLRLGGKRSAQKVSNSSSSHNVSASQQAPHCRGRYNCNCDNCSRTIVSSASTSRQRSSGNSDSERTPRASSSRTSIDLRQASSCEELISPRYNTWRCTTRPPATRRFSTTLQYVCSLPSFLRVVARRNIVPQIIRRIQYGTRGKVFTTRVSSTIGTTDTKHIKDLSPQQHLKLADFRVESAK